MVWLEIIVVLGAIFFGIRLGGIGYWFMRWSGAGYFNVGI